MILIRHPQKFGLSEFVSNAMADKKLAKHKKLFMELEGLFKEFAIFYSKALTTNLLLCFVVLGNI